jgi:1-aminocyclopropane-1-carboxylate deaminase/D-cysteine desulfhydrase-like pyridoxal-dependent ACC family enzyme
MRAILQLEDRVPDQDRLYATSGNVLLNHMLDAEIVTYPEGEDEAGADAALRARAELECSKGARPYLIPLALGHPPFGALGYVRAAEETVRQMPEFDVAVIASGSGLTHAGFLMGLHRLGHRARVVGSCVRRDASQQTARMRTVLDNLSLLMADGSDVPSERIRLWDGALAPGYGRIGPAAEAAMKKMAEYEGLLLDPVYTAKAFAAIPALIDSGEIEKGARVLFVHTGGLASLFAYQTELRSLFDRR